MGAAATAERAHDAQDVRPQAGPQELFASTPADIAIIGGSVFGGKTWSLVVEALRNIDVPGFTFVAFRREMPEHTNPGGMWQESMQWYPLAGGEPREHTHEWDFPIRDARGKITGYATGKFSSLQYEKDKLNWLGAQVCLFLFDQLETFTESLFFYMISRNRSTCGVRPYIRASCNPDPDSFLVKFIAWWIDDEGWAIPERSGVIRWFVRLRDDSLDWSSVSCAPDEYDRYDELAEQAKADLTAKHGAAIGRHAKSVTFVLARLQDNKIGNELDPDYESSIHALSYVERERLLGGDRGGNWKVRASAGNVFNRAWFKSLRAVPTNVVRWVRYWDKAGTQDGGKYSAGVLLGRCADGKVVIADVERGQWSAGNRENVIKQKAQADRALTPAVVTWVEQEPGSGGKESAENTIRNLSGHTIHAERVTGDKLTRASPLSAQVEAGNVYLLEAAWNEAFLAEAHRFDGKTGVMDQIDAAAGAFNKTHVGGGAVGSTTGW